MATMETSETMSPDTSSFLWFPLSNQTLTYMESKKREEEMRRARRCEENLKCRINSLLHLYRTRHMLSLLCSLDSTWGKVLLGCI